VGETAVFKFHVCGGRFLVGNTLVPISGIDTKPVGFGLRKEYWPRMNTDNALVLSYDCFCKITVVGLPRTGLAGTGVK